MSDSKYYILYPSDKVSYKYKNDFSKFDAPNTEKVPEYSALGLTNDFIRTGKKILPNLSISSKNLDHSLYINKKTQKMINKFDIKNFEEVKSFLEELFSKYKFPQLSTEESKEFSIHLAIFNLLFSYHRNIALICNSSAKDLRKDQFVQDTMKPRINNLKKIGEMLFDNLINVSEKKILNCKNNKDLRKCLLPHHNFLLNAVNEFTQQIDYSISLYIDIDKKATCPITKNIFHLVWYIFISYVISDVVPSKIGFCSYCGKIRKYKTKDGNKCEKCKYKGRTNKK